MQSGPLIFQTFVLPELAPCLEVGGWRLDVGTSSNFYPLTSNFQIGCRGFIGPVPLPLWIRVAVWGYSVVGGMLPR